MIRFNDTTERAVRRGAAGDRATAQAAARALGRRACGRAAGPRWRPALEAALVGSDDPRLVRQVVFLTDGSVGNEDAAVRHHPAAPGRHAAVHGGHRLRAERPLHDEGRGVRARHVHLRRRRARGRGEDGAALRRAREPGADRHRGELAGRRGRRGVAAARPRPLPRRAGGRGARGSRARPRASSCAAVAARSRGRRSCRSRARGTSDGVAVLWARRKVRVAARLACTTAPTPRRCAGEVVALGLEHHLVTKHTSLVAVDVTPSRPEDAGLQSSAAPDEPAARLGPRARSSASCRARRRPLPLHAALALLCARARGSRCCFADRALARGGALVSARLRVRRRARSGAAPAARPARAPRAWHGGRAAWIEAKARSRSRWCARAWRAAQAGAEETASLALGRHLAGRAAHRARHAASTCSCWPAPAAAPWPSGPATSTGTALPGRARQRRDRAATATRTSRSCASCAPGDEIVVERRDGERRALPSSRSRASSTTTTGEVMGETPATRG